MYYRWIIDNHHIAIESDDEILHPSAAEVYSFVSDGNVSEFPDPRQDLEGLRLSKVGGSIKCRLYFCDGEIHLKLFVSRKNRCLDIDMIEGQIIDHSISENEWFFVSGDIDTLQQMLQNAGIKNCGVITLGQYIDLLKQDYFSADRLIINDVEKSELDAIKEYKEESPKSIKANLYDYQKAGYIWIKRMLDTGHGCILGDEMGLGKTLQIITVFQSLKDRGQLPLLVVAPVSLLENWKRECAKFAPFLDVFVHHGSKRTGRYQEIAGHDVVIISYNTAVSDLSMLKMIPWSCVVLDEAQNIKNPYSERAKAVKALPRKGSVAVTGTPFENHITDIWSLVDFVVPGLFGSLSSFQQNVTDDVLGAEAIEPILSPIMIRRLVADVANDLPEKIIIAQPIEMSDIEKQEYERYRQEASDAVQSGNAVSLAILQKLRMYCTHYSICREETLSDPTKDSIKYQRLCEIMEEIISRNEKVIIFTSYKKMFDVFSKDLPARFEIEVDTINGETPVEDRQKIVDWFNALSKPAALILNPRAAGTGLNITGANHVIHYNLEWNPALEDQSSARAYRRGQEKTVFIYRLYYANTVEQVVNERIENKRRIASAAIVGNTGIGDDKDDILRALEIAPTLQKG